MKSVGVRVTLIQEAGVVEHDGDLDPKDGKAITEAFMVGCLCGRLKIAVLDEHVSYLTTMAELHENKSAIADLPTADDDIPF